MEIKIIAGKCKCKRKLDIRLTDVKENEDDPKCDIIIAWIVFGVCKKCKKVYIHKIFAQEERPVSDRDFIIDHDKVVKNVRKYKVVIL